MGNGQTFTFSMDGWGLSEASAAHFQADMKTENRRSYIFTTLQRHTLNIFTCGRIHLVFFKMWLWSFLPLFFTFWMCLGGCIEEPPFIMHHLVSDYVQYCAAFARYDYIRAHHKHLHINNLCATAVTCQRSDCTSWGHKHKVIYN